MSTDSTLSLHPEQHDSLSLPHSHPTRIGPYRITGILGRGGMGVVYRATVVVSCEVPIGQEVAIKLLRSADDGERARFNREASYLQKLRHPNIVRVYDTGTHGDQLYIVMQLLQGRHGDALVTNFQPLSQRFAADIVAQGLDALIAAHRQGILHRDLKPGNLIIGDDGIVRLLDFGLAQLMVFETSLTASGAVVGTPAYMSPEQARGERDLISTRSDIYGMGACLYEFLTGHPPFEADNPVAILNRVVNSTLTPARQWRSDIDADLETILLHSLARDPLDRYASASAMVEDLRRYLNGQRIVTRRQHGAYPMLRKAWLMRSSLATMGLGIFLSISLVALIIDIIVTPRPHRSPAPLPSTAIVTPTIEQEELLTDDPLGETVPVPVIDEDQNIPGSPIWQQVGALNTDVPPVEILEYPHSLLNMGYIEIPEAAGPVRVSTTVILGEDDDARVELMINNDQFGDGYRLSIVANDNEAWLSIESGGRTLIKQMLDHVSRTTPLILSLENNNDFITGSCQEKVLSPIPSSTNDGEALLIALPASTFINQKIEFFDAAGCDTNHGRKIYVAFTPHTDVTDVRRERLVRAGQISVISLIHALRLAGNYEDAVCRYNEFKHDYPNSEEYRDAQLGLAICNRRSGDPANIIIALDSCAELISTWRNNSTFLQRVTFQAWLCALDLERYQEAAEYLAALEQNSPIEGILNLVPPHKFLPNLLQDRLSHGQELAYQGLIDHAIDAFAQAEHLALCLKLNEHVIQARCWRGDLLRSVNGRTKEAVDVYTSIVNNPEDPAIEHEKAHIKIAETLRLSGEVNEAMAIYRALIERSAELPSELVQKARLWLGELWLDIGNHTEALSLWKSSIEDTSPYGQLMADLVADRIPTVPDHFTVFNNDILFFKARQAILHHHVDPALQELEESFHSVNAWEWPMPLVEQLINRRDTLIRDTPTTSP